MDIKKVTKSKDLGLNTDGHVVLTVTVGNAQKGASLLFFDENDIFAKGNIEKFDLGPAAGLAGKTLFVVTNVLDSNDASDNIVVTHVFSGCNPSVITHADVVDHDGDVYSLTYQFKFN